VEGVGGGYPGQEDVDDVTLLESGQSFACGQLGSVQQTLSARQKLHKHPKVLHPHHFATPAAKHRRSMSDDGCAASRLQIVGTRKCHEESRQDLWRTRRLLMLRTFFGLVRF